MKLCLPIAICGPFCSLLPTKMIAVPLPAAIASRTSGQVRSSIQTERVCALAGAVTTAANSAASIATSNCGGLTSASGGWNQMLSISQPVRCALERDDFSSNRHRALSFCLSMISAQTLCVCREGKPVPTHRVVAQGHAFPDHALDYRDLVMPRI